MDATPVDPAEVRRLFLQILELSGPERAKLLDTLSGGLREEVQALIDSDQGSETLLRGIVAGGRLPVAGPGERFGPFRTVNS